MKFGLQSANAAAAAEPEVALAVARAAESCGVESLWTVEHVVVPKGFESEYPYTRDRKMPTPATIPLPDPLIWLAWVAGQTSTLRLATGILIVPERNPVVLAKELATLDRLAGGRLLLGVGTGWLREEYEALGVPFAGRGRRLDDSIGAMRALWTQAEPTHHGEFSSFTEAISEPKPCQASIPIVVGGHTDAAARRAGRIGDGFYPGRSTVSSLTRLIGAMRAAVLEVGRDPDLIEITAVAPQAVDEAKRLIDLGVSRLTFHAQGRDAASMTASIGRYAEDFMGHFERWTAP